LEFLRILEGNVKIVAERSGCKCMNRSYPAQDRAK